MSSREFSARHWYRLSWLSCLLAPLSLLFLFVVVLRRAAYSTGLLAQGSLPVPVLVVGNFVVGGTGKTPLVLWLVEGLRRLGWRPAIISRGYGGGSDAPREVRPDSDPGEVGDEPLLLARRSNVPVFVGRRRLEVGRKLLASYPDCDLLVSDDGLQHYALARSFEIAVEDSRGYGNGLLLPAGPLRELPSRSVDAIVLNGGPDRVGVWKMDVTPAEFYALHAPTQPVAADGLRFKRLHAVAGIGHPQRFFDMLHGLGLVFVSHPFPDHHVYRPEDLQFADCDAVLMTEKDAVKCSGFGRLDLYALRVEAVVDEALIHLIDSRLR
ncbi:MAG TPA: tetraacyldisaccharide 4'-kinase [Burkholderiales bacterium]|nr:tetraacyldisaccharide 4'-kinase [Burkholderiales bacterium]